MRRKNSPVIVLGFLVLALITACQPEESITVNDISGVWMDESGGPYLIINENGTYGLSATTRLPEKPNYEYGQFTLEGNTQTFSPDEESPHCAGYSASFKIVFLEEDRVRATLKENNCPEPYQDTTYWLRISP